MNREEARRFTEERVNNEGLAAPFYVKQTHCVFCGKVRKYPDDDDNHTDDCIYWDYFFPRREAS
jgi:hypothetical protein